MSRNSGYRQVGGVLGWSEFQECLFGLLDEWPAAQFGEWIFRGQRNSEWGLQPALRRLVSGPQIDAVRLNSIVAEVLEGFRNELARQGLNPTFLNSGSALLGLAQHYGVPTNLLDWSYSPYVAAYFAFQSVSAADGNVAVWALDTRHRLVSSAEGERNTMYDVFTPELVLVSPQAYENVRLRNQAGTFTLLRSGDLTVEEFFAHGDCSDPDSPLVKFTLRAGDAAVVRRDLALMMIGDGDLFPGIESAAVRAGEALRRLTLGS